MVVVRGAVIVEGSWVPGVSIGVNGAVLVTGELGADFNGIHYPASNSYNFPAEIFLSDGSRYVFSHINHPYMDVYADLEIPEPSTPAGEFYIWGGHPSIQWPDTIDFIVEAFYVPAGGGNGGVGEPMDWRFLAGLALVGIGILVYLEEK